MSEGKPIKIVAMGKYLPKQVASSEIETKLGIPEGWSKNQTLVDQAAT